MTVLSELVAKLTLDSSNYDAGLEGAEKKTKSSMSAIGASMTATGRTMQRTGGIMTASLTLPIVAAGVKMVDMASALEESRSKVKVVFGDMADSIEDFASTAAMNLGMSTQEVLAATGTYGNLFRSMEIGVDASTDMSMGLVTLAADLASFNDMDPTLVLDKLRSGLTGETEPLKVLGINLNQASIQAKAMEMGLMGAGEQLTASAKAQASYALIMEQTVLAQGDFARTSDGMANSSRQLKAQLSDLSGELGTKLLPIGLKIVTVLSGLIDKFTNLPEPVQNGILVFLGVVAALGPIITIIGTVMTAIGGLISAWGAVSGAVAGASAAFTAAIPVIGAVVAPFLPIIAILAAVGVAIYLLHLAWKNNFMGIQDTVKLVTDNIKAVFSAFVAILKGDWTGAMQILKDAWNNTWDAITGRINWIKEKIVGLGATLKGITLPDWLIGHSPSPFEKTLAGIATAMDKVIGKTPSLDFSSTANAPSRNMAGGLQLAGFGDKLDAAFAGISTPASAARQGPGASGQAPKGMEVVQHIYNQVDAQAILGQLLDLLEERR